jgi:2-Cys peroxiredoxin 5
MASILTSALKGTTAAAHSAFATLASASQISVGAPVPDVDVKINAPDQKLNFSKVQGKNVIVLVPAAFSPVCSETVSRASGRGERNEQTLTIPRV